MGMDKAAVWHHTHAERAALAATLRSLPASAWAHPTLCPGWTVHDIAAHVISHPQIGWRETGAMLGRNLGRSYDTMIFREVKRLGARATRAGILADYERLATSTRHVPITTSIEPLVDALLHHQDIVRPLGITHAMDPAAAAVAADRIRLLAPLIGTGRLLRSIRLVATDIDWDRGRGPVVAGPVQELLMLASGREPDRTLLEGPGTDALPARPGG